MCGSAAAMPYSTHGGWGQPPLARRQQIRRHAGVATDTRPRDESAGPGARRLSFLERRALDVHLAAAKQFRSSEADRTLSQRVRAYGGQIHRTLAPTSPDGLETPIRVMTPPAETH